MTSLGGGFALVNDSYYRDAMASRWAATRPEHVTAWLDPQATTAWWFAGGWAIELFLGVAIREHSDLEIGCFRDSTNELIAQLARWRPAWR